MQRKGSYVISSVLSCHPVVLMTLTKLFYRTITRYRVAGYMQYVGGNFNSEGVFWFDFLVAGGNPRCLSLRDSFEIFAN